MMKHVETAEPCRQATEAGTALRHGLNKLFDEAGMNWVAYGGFSLTHVLPDYDGPRPASDDFVPYGGDLKKLDRPIERRIAHAFRCAALLGGVDCMGMGMITSAAHDAAVVERSLDGFKIAIDLLQAEGIATSHPRT